MGSDSTDLLYKIALTHIPKVGSVLAKNLISFCGGPEGVFKQKKRELIKIPGIGSSIAHEIINQQAFKKAEAEIKFLEKHQIESLFYLDNTYPIRLKQIRDAPILLYYKGGADLNKKHAAAIVGTRKATPYGTIQCEKLIEDLKAWDVLIISGLAYGIDVTAHRKAVDIGLSTVGVLGSGLDRMYPAAHRKIARTMVENDGGLITEFGMGIKPDRENFPMRNRIIAGMVDVLIVVESDIKGGSMITADIANGYHKDVFALPGRIGDQYSSGCNFLIKTNRALLVENGKELAQIMQWQTQKEASSFQQRLFQDFSEEEMKICSLLDRQIPVIIDKIYKESPYPISKTSTILLELELKNAVRVLPGKMYIKI